jgi:hypothetical protein
MKQAQKNGEGFMPSGAQIAEASLDEGIAEDRLPGLLPSVLTLAAVMVLSAGFHLNVVTALAIGCVLAVLAGRKNLFPGIKQSLANGVTAVYGPVLNVSATYAIGIAVKSVAGFSFFESFFTGLPGLLGAPMLGVATAFIMASVSAPIPAFGPQMLELYLAAGVSAENAHRMMMITCFSSIAPHNAGISNAASVLRIPYAECLKMYAITTYIPGIATLLASLLCLRLGM